MSATASHRPILQRLFTGIVSVLFHPVFVPLYAIAFLVYLHPSAFTGFSEEARLRVLLVVAFNAVFFPLLSVILLKSLGFISSIQLREQKDRIIPFISAGIFFFWTYTVFKEQAGFPALIRIFLLGIFLASSLGLLINIFIKVSLHAIGMGGWVGFFLIIALEGSMLMTWPLAVVLLITGLVMSARLMAKAHDGVELAAGFVAGIIAQLTAWFFLVA